MKNEQNIQRHDQAIATLAMRREQMELYLGTLTLAEVPEVLQTKREVLVELERLLDETKVLVEDLKLEILLTKDVIELLRYKPQRVNGERHGRTKLSDARIQEIREQFAQGDGYGVLSKRFLVHKQTIAKVVRGERRKLQPKKAAA